MGAGCTGQEEGVRLSKVYVRTAEHNYPLGGKTPEKRLASYRAVGEVLEGYCVFTRDQRHVRQ